jgi:hypothetical protein
LPSSVKLEIAISTEVALKSLFPTPPPPHQPEKYQLKASKEANFQYAT